MSLSDCDKCWSTPCSCGYDYKDWPDEAFYKFIHDIIVGRDKYKKEKNLETKKSLPPITYSST